MFDEAYRKLYDQYHWDTFYDKKRNFPTAEEREYDDIEAVGALLTRPDQTMKGVHCSARFKPGTHTCMLSLTKRDLARKSVPFGKGYIVTTNDGSYQVKDYHLNYYPKYVVADLEPAAVDHRNLLRAARV